MSDTLEVAKLVVTTLATGVAALYGIRIAASQRDIAKRQAATASEAREIAQAKLNLDLFDKRLLIYDKTRSILASYSCSVRDLPWEPLNEFNELIPKATFLFGADIREYMQEIHQMWQVEAAGAAEMAARRPRHELHGRPDPDGPQSDDAWSTKPSHFD